MEDALILPSSSASLAFATMDAKPKRKPESDEKKRARMDRLRAALQRRGVNLPSASSAKVEAPPPPQSDGGSAVLLPSAPPNAAAQHPSVRRPPSPTVPPPPPPPPATEHVRIFIIFLLLPYILLLMQTRAVYTLDRAVCACNPFNG